ncbi:hypothetical protein VIGAN_01173600 [Vigna angularis var. angularis]|uniref:Uncharacterized protein n=1 Tax=Vigna angularis var. angularis TaxID=157739 RepID=A0A0S3R0J1_PHAAN|nr:hypothetical protein VIGAN_01173600 [Vigna angularis var. angularis]
MQPLIVQNYVELLGSFIQGNQTVASLLNYTLNSRKKLCICIFIYSVMCKKRNTSIDLPQGSLPSSTSQEVQSKPKQNIS